MNDIRLITLNKYIRPVVKEDKNKGWVMNGVKNSFYDYIIEMNSGSPTNASINKTYADLIYGRGLTAKNINTSVQEWTMFKTMLDEKDLMNIIFDFQVFGEACIQIIKQKGDRNKISSLGHIPKNLIIPSVENEDGEIESYWYCKNWQKTATYEPVEIPVFGTSNEAIEVYIVKPYQIGRNYFSDPDYVSGLPYCEMEMEIANLNINSIKNGLSAGYIINVPDGHSWTPEEQQNFERKVRQKLTGSPNASTFVISFNGRDVEISITPFPQNENIHKQWHFLTEEAKMQILTSHRCTSPSIIGLISSSGFSNTADEMDKAEEQLIKRVIQPKQQFILNALKDIVGSQGIFLDFYFLPFTEEKAEVSLSSDIKEIDLTDIANALIEKGEVIDEEEWEVVEDEKCDAITLKESELNNIFELASTPKTSDKKSKQDTSLFKIRYRYAGNLLPQRSFCKKVMLSDKVYRAEDLDDNYNYNEEFAPKGKSSYNIFLFKGGVNCKHFWERVIYMKKGNEKISVNKAKKLILELDPPERKKAMWEQNDKRVAQIAEQGNNYWSLKPNYRS